MLNVWFPVFFVASGANSMLVKTRIDLHSRRWNCGSQVSHAHQIVGSAGEGKDPVHFVDPTMSDLAQERNRLQPARAFFKCASGNSRAPRRRQRAAQCRLHHEAARSKSKTEILLRSVAGCP